MKINSSPTPLVVSFLRRKEMTFSKMNSPLTIWVFSLHIAALIGGADLAFAENHDQESSRLDICPAVMFDYSKVTKNRPKGKQLGTKVTVNGVAFRIDDSGTATALIVKKGSDEEPLKFAETIEFWKRGGNVYALINLAARNRQGRDKVVLKLDRDGNATPVCSFRQSIKYVTTFYSRSKQDCDDLGSGKASVYADRPSEVATKPLCSIGSDCTFGEMDVDIDNDGAADRVLVERFVQGRASDYTRLYVLKRDRNVIDPTYFEQMYSKLDDTPNQEHPFSGKESNVIRYKDQNYVSIESNDFKKTIFVIEPKTGNVELMCQFRSDVQLHLTK